MIQSIYLCFIRYYLLNKMSDVCIWVNILVYKFILVCYWMKLIFLYLENKLLSLFCWRWLTRSLTKVLYIASVELRKYFRNRANEEIFQMVVYSLCCFRLIHKPLSRVVSEISHILPNKYLFFNTIYNLVHSLNGAMNINHVFQNSNIQFHMEIVRVFWIITIIWQKVKS